MQSRPTKVTFRMKKDENGSSSLKTEENGITESTFPGHLDSPLQQPNASSSSEEEDDHSSDDEDNQSSENVQNQLVVYDPTTNGDGEIEAVQPLRSSFPNQSSRVLPSVGAFTIQCANCFKWRLIPTKEKYEEIREHILEQPFLCETAREWRPEILCDDPEDISQDGSRLWAIDKPNIALPPPGWQRLLRIRGEGSTKFADVYYVAPSGKRLRSMVEIQKYLQEHPEYMTEGVTMSQFSFQTPRPLQENYVRKRPARLTGTLEPSEVHPIAWVGPDEITDLQLGGPGASNSDSVGPAHEPVNRPLKKKARTQSNQTLSVNDFDNQRKVKVEEPHQARNGTYNL